jgi:hypothetical protein
LRHVLNKIEGHYIQGFADGQNSPDTSIRILPGAVEEAANFLQEHSATEERINRVVGLIEGFETPFGMELLSSVHWIAARENPAARTDVEAAIAGVHNWNERKQKLMHPDHIRRLAAAAGSRVDLNAANLIRLTNNRWLRTGDPH